MDMVPEGLGNDIFDLNNNVMGPLYTKAHLDILLVGFKETPRERIASVIRTSASKEKVLSVAAAPTRDMARAYIKANRPTCVIIDLFAMGTDVSVPFIEELRNGKDTDHIAICIAGSGAELTRMREITTNWRERFKHYYQLYHDLEPDDKMKQQVEEVLDCFLADRVKVQALRAYVTTRGWYFSFKYSVKRALQNETVQSSAVAAIIGGLFVLVSKLFEKDCP